MADTPATATWQPNAEQQARIEQLVRALLPLLESIWGVDAQLRSHWLEYRDSPLDEYPPQRFAALHAATMDHLKPSHPKPSLGDADLERAMVDVLCFPAVVDALLPPAGEQTIQQAARRARADLIQKIAARHVRDRANDYSTSSLAARLRYLV